MPALPAAKAALVALMHTTNNAVAAISISAPAMAGEAELKYLDGDFRVVRPGAFVRCAVADLPGRAGAPTLPAAW